ncbi:TonB-dependent receptor [Wenzhouxiangella sp. AB-CW3]|uniref:TonB-dependent receptor plug domain-containing protein n=1 Tax=Wenzhouxiangella sp. AB-CW3 TaxID=2771012 RepID=UPI00168B4B1D|nr:TonB-dependent receptor [Wenzhouxiangella sp. AB-CW3]QOC21473.1 TonB-dependent receptor [Wenzhouxiangella sp. AB-CW3]
MKHIHTALLATAVAAGTMAMGEVKAGDEAEETVLDRVQVTGSRISRLGIERISPVETYDRETLEFAGVQTAQDLFLRMPAVGAGTFSAQGDSNDDTGPDTASVSLRGLGSNATLILVNGRRVANSPFAKRITESGVDLNTIPVSAIDRVEVLKDGASAVYGTDAIAGVVNIILRDDLDGAEFHANYGTSYEGDADETRLSLLWGTQGDRTSTMVTLDYYKRDTLWKSDRRYSQSANKAPLHPAGLDFRSSLGSDPGAYFLLDSEEWQPDPACPPDRISGSGEFCLFDYSPDMQLRPNSERASMFVNVDHELAADQFMYFEGWAHYRNSQIHGAPAPSVDELFISADHPGNPFGEDLMARYRPVDVGRRIQDQRHVSLRGVLGVAGMISENWDYDVALGMTRHHAQQDGINGFMNVRLFQEVLDDFSYDPFGTQPNDPEVIDRFTSRITRTGTSRQRFFDAGVDGIAGELPGGPIGLAAGYQYREESIRDIPDIQFRRGEIIGTEATQVQGSRDINSVYAEAVFPLLDNLELQTALRHDDYSDFGSTTNPRIGVMWRVTDELSLRASWSEGFRAPSIPEIGLGATEESPIMIDTARCELTGDDQDCGPTEYIVEFSGNPDLQPETSESINMGVIWQALDNLSLSVDYWQIEHEGLIGSDTQWLLDNEGTNEEFVVRLPPTSSEAEAGIPGRIDFVRDTFFNFGNQKVEGVDFDVRYTGRELWGGVYSVNTLVSYTTTFDRQFREGQPVEDLNGTWQRPKLRAFASFDWEGGNWGWSAGLRHIGSYDDDSLMDLGRKVSAWTVLDLQFRYHTEWDGTFTLNIDNALDNEPPFAASDIWGYDLGTHDPRGGFITLGYRQEF